MEGADEVVAICEWKNETSMAASSCCVQILLKDIQQHLADPDKVSALATAGRLEWQQHTALTAASYELKLEPLLFDDAKAQTVFNGKNQKWRMQPEHSAAEVRACSLCAAE